MKRFYTFISIMIFLSVVLQLVSVCNELDISTMDRQIKSYELFIVEQRVKITELELKNEELKSIVFGTLSK